MMGSFFSQVFLSSFTLFRTSFESEICVQSGTGLTNSLVGTNPVSVYFFPGIFLPL